MPTKTTSNPSSVMIYRYIAEVWRRPKREVRNHLELTKSTFYNRINEMVDEGSIEQDAHFLWAVDNTPDRDSPGILDSPCHITERTPISVHGTQIPGILDLNAETDPEEWNHEQEDQFEAWAQDQAAEYTESYVKEHGQLPDPHEGYMGDCCLPVRLLRAADRYVQQYRDYNQVVFRYRDAKDKSKVPLPWYGDCYVPWRDIAERLKGLRTYFLWWGADGAPILNRDDADEFFRIFGRYAQRMGHNLLHDLEREYYGLCNSEFKLTEEEQALVKSPHRKRPDKTIKEVEPAISMELAHAC